MGERTSGGGLSMASWLFVGTCILLGTMATILWAGLRDGFPDELTYFVLGASSFLVPFFMPVTWLGALVVARRERASSVKVALFAQGLASVASSVTLITWWLFEATYSELWPDLFALFVLENLSPAVTSTILVGGLAYVTSKPTPSASATHTAGGASTSNAHAPTSAVVTAGGTRRVPVTSPPRPEAVDLSGGEGSVHVEILKTRLARGEITPEEYRQLRHALSEP